MMVLLLMVNLLRYYLLFAQVLLLEPNLRWNWFASGLFVLTSCAFQMGRLVQNLEQDAPVGYL